MSNLAYCVKHPSKMKGFEAANRVKSRILLEASFKNEVWTAPNLTNLAYCSKHPSKMKGLESPKPVKSCILLEASLKNEGFGGPQTCQILHIARSIPQK